MFDVLEETGNANFHELVQIVRGDGQELDALQQRIADIARFFQHAPVKLQPLHVAIEIVAGIVERYACHKPSWARDEKYLRCVTGR